MNELPYFIRQLPFFGFLLVGAFVVLILIFRYRSRTPLTIYYLSFVALALGLGEFWLWATTYTPARTFSEGSYMTNHWSADKELGYGLTRGPRKDQAIKRSFGGELVYDVIYSVDALGLREVPDNGVEPPVFFFGDSFTFGEGVGDDDTLPAQFAKISSFSAFNFGVHGYGPHQFLRMLEVSRPEQIGIKKERPLVVFTVLPTHIDRAAGRAFWDLDGPLYEASSTGLNLRGPFQAQRSMADRIANKSYIYKLIQPMLSETADRQRLLAILERASKIVKTRYGTDMLVVVWDTGWREVPKYEVDRAVWIRDSLTKRGIANLSVSQIVPPVQGVEYYIAGDGHPNRAAYAAVAKAVFQHCNEVDCFRRN